MLIVLRLISFQVTPNFGWFIFCGVFLALSVFVPGLSFSTMLMPLGLYTPLVEGVGNLSFEVLIPAGIGGLLAIILLSKAIIRFFEKYYSVAYHAIVGIVFAASLNLGRPLEHRRLSSLPSTTGRLPWDPLVLER